MQKHHGRVLFLDFWASWCEPCKESIPLIQRYAAAHPEVDVVSRSTPASRRDPVRAYVQAHPMKTVALDPDLVAAHAFGVVDFPTLVAIDPTGNVRAKWVGYNADIAAVMDEAVKRLSPKPAARHARGTGRGGRAATTDAGDRG